MRVTILYDNTAARSDLKADWGFAALVEARLRRAHPGPRSDIAEGNVLSPYYVEIPD